MVKYTLESILVYIINIYFDIFIFIVHKWYLQHLVLMRVDIHVFETVYGENRQVFDLFAHVV